MIDFPQNPTIGQQFTAAGVIWVWDGVKWAPSGLSIPYLPLAGGTLTGALQGTTANFSGLITANDPPVADNSKTLATTEWINSNARWGDNRIINGDMRIDQRNNGAAGTATNAYTIDRWRFAASQPSKGQWIRGTGPAPVGFPYCLNFGSSSAYTALATDVFAFYQPIEADMVSDFAWGTANAQPVTLSFYASSNVAGTFSGAIQNAAETRSYPFSFTLPTVNIFTKIVITIPGDTAGTWVMSGNAASIFVIFDLGSGSNFRTSGGAWVAGNYWGVIGAQSIISANGAAFNLTGVKLEIGSVATPFNRQSLAKSMADCQRYYQTGNWGLGGYSTVGVANYTQSPLPVLMRATPTVTYTINTPGNISTASPSVVGAATLAINTTVAANGGFSANGTYTLSAEL